ncbi:MAG: HAMP domain-containing sensor histidine kinase [Verrucomicrobiota bacterium]
MPVIAATPIPRRFTHVGVLALTILVFGGVVALVAWQLRAGLREQALRREADLLGAVASMQLSISAEAMGEEAVADVPGALLVAVVKASTKLSGVVGVRVFDARQTHNASDGILGEPKAPSPDDWAKMVAGEPFARLHKNWADEIEFVEPLNENVEIVEAWVPLKRAGVQRLLGAAQFWLDGAAARAELAAHDRRLWTQAGVAWLGGSLVIGLALSWAFRRLAAANEALQARGEDLQRANRELVLAAKTSALGAVTAHLMHELKNPIAGLEGFMAAQGELAVRGESGDELAAASELTRRLRTMVNDVVGVLRDEQTGATFELTAADIAELVQDKVKGEAKKRGVAFVASGASDVTIAGRRGNLAILVLRNLAQNAIEATPEGGTVRLTGGRAGDGSTEFLVEDTGGGLAPAVRERLFQPCASTKVGGSGVGLALSHQLAQQAGGRLELVRSDLRGTCFRLVLSPEA